MDFEWDENKSNSNKTKHGIDFSTAQLMWDDANRVEIEAPYPLERRGILISKIGKNLWTAIFTRRDNAIRIISVRRARKREADLYDKKENS